MISFITNKIVKNRVNTIQNQNQQGRINTATKPYANDCFTRSAQPKTQSQPAFKGGIAVHNTREVEILKRIVELKNSILHRLQEPRPFSDDMLELLGEKNARKPELAADHLGIAKAYLEYNPDDAMCQFHAHMEAKYAIGADPENHEAHFIYGNLEADPKEAIEHLTEAVHLDPLNTQYLQTRAKRHFDEGNRDGTIEDYTSLTTFLEPGNADLLAEKARAHIHFGENLEALSDFDAVIKLAPQKPEGHHGRANALLNMGHLDEAAQSYETALKFNPNPEDAMYIHTNLGSCHMLVENFPKAIEHFTEALKLAPDGDTYYHRAFSHFMLGHNEAAVQDAQEALAQGTKQTAAISLQAISLSSLGRHVDSRITINKGKDAFPEHDFQDEIKQLALTRLDYKKSQRGE